MKTELSTTLIIVGITGDLSQRMLLPAIENIAKADMLPDNFKIIGISRRDVNVEEVVDSSLSFVKANLEMLKMDLDDVADYKKLGTKLSEVEAKHAGESQRLYYLSVPPIVSSPIITHLGESGLARVPHTKLLLEKPFGTDLSSAKDLIGHIKQYFEESMVYRIDHFMAKEMAQNIVVFRSENSLFKHTWNKDFITSIDIVASETIGIEGRTTMYEQTGALRDLIQSHLMQLAALTLMELPGVGHWQDIPSYRLKALQQLQPPKDVTVDSKRAQYEGYRDEVKNPDSMIETFATVSVNSSDPNWEGVPITLSTGKALKEKYTDIRIHYKPVDDDREANELTIRVSPDEQISFCIWAKKPGFDHTPEMTPLNFSYENHKNELPEAYEKVFVDALRSDHSLFTTSQEVLESWRVLEPVIEHWSKQENIEKYSKKSDISDILQR